MTPRQSRTEIRTGLIYARRAILAILIAFGLGCGLNPLGSPAPAVPVSFVTVTPGATEGVLTAAPPSNDPETNAPQFTETLIFTATPSPELTATSTPIPLPATFTPSPTGGPSLLTDTPIPTPTLTWTPTLTPIPTDTSISTPTPTWTFTLTPTPTGTPTSTPTSTWTPTLTPTPTNTPTTPPPAPADGSVKGIVQVHNIQGEPSPMVGVKVQALLADLETQTNDAGEYTIDNVPPGEEFIAVEAFSVLTEFQSVTVQPGQTSTADFTLIQAIPGPCVLRGNIEGRVLVNSAPAPGARVWVHRGSGEAVTDINGHYIINNMCSGLVLAEWKAIRGGIVVQVVPQETITAPDILLAPR